MKNDVLSGETKGIKYTKGESNIVTGIKQKDARKLESNGAIGGNGTYRNNTSALLEVYVKINGSLHNIDIKNFIKDELGFARFTEYRITHIIASLPSELYFISQNDDDSKFNLDQTNEISKKWIVYLQKIFSGIITILLIKNKNYIYM